jgi:carbon monoxide dehydrogenase subunit G
MQMSGQQRIAADRQSVWRALNDPETLRRSIPGCQSLEREADDRLRAVVEVKIGPISARFAGAVTLSDIDPPNGYTIAGEGQGGTVGFAKGGAKVRLADSGDGGTLLSYEVEAQVGGRLAQLGGPLIDATAKQLAGRFFQQFGEAVATPAAETPAPAAAAPAAPAIAAPAVSPKGDGGVRGAPGAWLAALLAAALVGYLVGHAQRGGAEGDWMGLAIGLLVVVVAAAGFEFGRRAAAPVVVLDAALLARLTKGAER